MQCNIIKSRFMEKNNPLKVIDEAIWRTKALTQAVCLQQTNKTKTIPPYKQILQYFFLPYQSHGKIRNIFNKHWPILLKDPYLKITLSNKPEFTFRRAKTLKNHLALSRFHTTPTTRNDNQPMSPK